MATSDDNKDIHQLVLDIETIGIPRTAEIINLWFEREGSNTAAAIYGQIETEAQLARTSPTDA